MNRMKLLKIVNPLMAVVFAGLAGAGIFHELIPYELFRVVHPLAGYLLVALVIVHLYLNWDWIKNVLLRRS